MSPRIGFHLKVAQVKSAMCGLALLLPIGSAAYGADHLLDIDFEQAGGRAYADDSSQYVQVSHRPSCRSCQPNCCTCQPAYTPAEQPSDAAAESPSDTGAYEPEGAPLSPGQFAATDTGTFASSMQGGISAMQSNVGYVDSAMIWSQLRLRYDNASNSTFPDRAEFNYPQSAILGQANGLLAPETSIDYQDISLYAENAFNNRLSVFAELPIRFLDPDINPNTSGLGDMNAGIKYAMIAQRDTYFTFQFKTYIPTGDADRGLGVNHVSVEPGLLLFHRMGRVRWESELRHWISVGGSDIAGNVIRYGTGLGYDVFADYRTNTRLTPVVEFVGWTVLDGGKSDPFNGGAVLDAQGDTIVNLKIGTRFVSGANSVYGGWGHAITGDVWYEDLLRLEYRRVF